MVKPKKLYRENNCGKKLIVDESRWKVQVFMILLLWLFVSLKFFKIKVGDKTVYNIPS